MAKKYNVTTTGRAALPRNKRRMATGDSSGGTTINVSGGGSSSEGVAHEHSNLPVLESLSNDDEGYLYMRNRLDGALESTTNKVKAGYADDAKHAIDADNATQWQHHDFDDYLDQGVRSSDSVRFQDVTTDSIVSAGQFVDGLTGAGFKIWKDEGGITYLTLDKLTVRQTMTVMELLISRIRSVGGQIAVSAANGKIEAVEEDGSEYRITFEGGNQWQPHDLMRCQTFTGGDIRGYWVEIKRVDGKAVVVDKNEFSGIAPQVGDECVLMGNTQLSERQNMILIAATEDGKPRIDVMNGINRKSLDGCLRARLGNLDGINNDAFDADSQPQGDGLYADNVYLKGKFILNTGEDVATRFAVTEEKIESSVKGLREDFMEDKGYLNNATFADGMNKWTMEHEAVFYLVGNKWIWANDNVLTKQGNGASLTADQGRTVVRIKNKRIIQHNANLRVRPTMGTTSDGLKTPIPVYLSFFYRCATGGMLNVRFTNVNKAGFVTFDSLNVSKVLEPSDTYQQFTCSGQWNGTGDFELSFSGDIYLYMLILSTDKLEAFKYEHRTLFEQSDKLVTIAGQSFDSDGRLLSQSGAVLSSEFASLFSQAVTANGLVKQADISTFITADQAGNLISNAQIRADQITLEGVVTANNYFKILEDGSVEAAAGKIGGFSIEDGTLYWKQRDYFGSDSRSVRIGVSRDSTTGVVDVAFNAATQGRFGVKVVGSNMGGACIYASSKSSGQSYPSINNTYAGYFDGNVMVSDTVYSKMCLSESFGYIVSHNSDGTTTYNAGVSFGTDKDLDHIRLNVRGGIIVGVYDE